MWKHLDPLFLNIANEVGNSCELKEGVDILAGFSKHLEMGKERVIFFFLAMVLHTLGEKMEFSVVR